MTTLRETKVSLALVLAIGALMLGTIATAATAAVAAPHVASKLTKAKVKKIADKQITKRAKTLNVDMVDGYHANQLVRATKKVQFTGQFTATSYTDIITRQVTAPTKGIFVIMATIPFNQFVGDPDPAFLSFRGTVDGTAATIETYGFDDNVNFTHSTGVVSGAVAVTKGNHTVAIQAQIQGDGDASISDSSMTVLFVPFGNNGAAGSLG